MQSQNHDLTKFVVLKCHERAFHNGVKQTLNKFRNEFWVNRGRNYMRKLLSTCVIYKRS